jgi:hypothetical protein
MKIESFMVSENSIVRLIVGRGPVWLLADNNQNLIELLSKDAVNIRKSESIANFIYV